jgi:hypothetical protein
MKLTKKQQEQLDQLKKYGPLYVGYNSRPVMNVFEKLVEKGFAVVVGESTYGKTYATK